MKRTAFLIPAIFAALNAAQAQEDSFELGEIAPAKPPPPLYTSVIEAGVGYQSADTFHFGRYGGVTDQGPFAIVKGTLDGGDAWNDGRKFWNADVNIYGFDSLSVQARGGVQGSWRVGASYDGFTRAITDSAKTPFLGVGGDRLTLPTNWVTGAFSAQFSTLNASATPIDLSVKWQSMGGDFVLVPYAGYELRLQITNRNRDGLRPQSLTFGHEGNFPVGVFFPQPVDYNSNQVTASFGHNGPKLQWNAAYSISIFSNGIDSVTVQNPFARSLSNVIGNIWPAGAFAGYPRSIGQYSLPPNSAAQQFLVSGGYTVTPKTRLTLRLSYQLQTQDEPFLPYTANTQLSVLTPLPRGDLDGKVHKTHVAINLTSREWKNVDVAAGYILDRRHNLSPMDVYSYVANDVQDQIQPLVPGNSRYIRLNLPYSFTFQEVKAEAGYRIVPRTRISLAYTGDFRKRDYQQVATSEEHTFKAKVLSTFTRGSAWISGTYASRDGSTYDNALPWVLSHTESYLTASGTRDGIEQPLMRKYNLADRRRNEAKGGVTLDAAQNLAVDLSGGYAKDNYLHSAIGLRSSDSLRMDADVSYVLGKIFTVSAFAGYERIRANLNGYLIFDTASGNPNRAWNTRNRDSINSAGMRLTWQAVPDKFKVDGSYTLSDGTSRTGVQSFQGFVGTMSSPLPAARDITHTGNIAGDYAFRPDTALRLGYTIARHSTRDWQYANMGLAPVAQILGSGIVPPRYTVHVVWLTTRYQF